MDLRLVGGRYHIERFVGEGGVARIYKARDILTNETVALKMARAEDPACADAVKNEFRFAVTHPHPTLVTPLAIRFESGLPIIVMPFIHGREIQSLNAFDPRCPFKRKSNDAVDRFLACLLECAAFIHYSGYIYNDFKPSNLIIPDRVPHATGRGYHPLLLDFNLVSRIGETLKKSGTVEYVAPEILLGQPAQPASDLYSIGAMLFELLSGAPPYAASDTSELIRMVTETGQPDLSAIPSRFRDTIAALLSRDPAQRPRDARESASMLGVGHIFDTLCRSHVGYYLSAGAPPFADQLKTAVLNYVNSGSEQLFLIYGLCISGSDLDYLSAELVIPGFCIERIRRGDNQILVTAILDRLVSRGHENARKDTILLIDDITSISQPDRHRLRALMRPANGLPVVASMQRWQNCGLPHLLFDPLESPAAESTTRTVLSSHLKHAGLQFDCRELSQATGGDPELIYLRLRAAVEAGCFDLLAGEDESNAVIDDAYLSGLESPLKRMFSSSGESGQQMLVLLSCWGNEIPMILLAGLSKRQKETIDCLVASGHLVRGKSFLAFPSEDSRRFIYSSIPDPERRRLHRFWALAADEYLDGAEEFPELSAVQWGQSDDIIRGYESNMIAAKELFNRGELARAKSNAVTLLRLAENGGGPRSSALMMHGDIAKQEGDYASARQSYVELLRILRKDNDLALKAETYKDLGDLYRSTKIPRKALHYIKRALPLFERLHDEQGVANCHNNIGLILWINEEYMKALEAFQASFEINQRLENYQEIAKIQSNIGIIKDIMGNTSEVGEYFEQALFNAHKGGDSRLEALIANNLGYFHIRQNELVRALSYLEQAVQIGERIGYLESVVNALGNQAICHLRLGNLFQSIDCSQRALKTVEALDNKYLAADPQLHLIEVSILMGNYALADGALTSLETDQTYQGNKALRAQVDFLRCRLQDALGNHKSAGALANSIHDYSESIGDSRLALEARLAAANAICAADPGQALAILPAIANESDRLGHLDLTDAAGLLMTQAYLLRKETSSAGVLIEKLLSRPGQSKGILIEARIYRGRLLAMEAKYDDAINLLSETESIAASSGFLPRALEAAVELAEIYVSCGKVSRGNDTAKRAQIYADRILLSLPPGLSMNDHSRLPVMARLHELKKQVMGASNARV